jgi:hypothetical protein
MKEIQIRDGLDTRAFHEALHRTAKVMNAIAKKVIKFGRDNGYISKGGDE